MAQVLITRHCNVGGTDYRKGEVVVLSEEAAREVVEASNGIVRNPHDERETKTGEAEEQE